MEATFAMNGQNPEFPQVLNKVKRGPKSKLEALDGPPRQSEEPPKRRGRKPGSKNKPKAGVPSKAAASQSNSAKIDRVIAASAARQSKALHGVDLTTSPHAADGLVPARALTQVLQVLVLGAAKYKGKNWSQRPNDHVAKAFAHLTAPMSGVTKDPESGLSPLAHAAARLILALEVDLEK